MRGTPLPSELWRNIYLLDPTHRGGWNLAMLELELLCPFISHAQVLSQLRRTRLVFTVGGGGRCAPVGAARRRKVDSYVPTHQQHERGSGR